MEIMECIKGCSGLPRTFCGILSLNVSQRYNRVDPVR